MKMSIRLKTTITGLNILLAIAASFALGSCSPKPDTNQSPPSDSGAAETTAKTGSIVTASAFDVTGAWKPQKVTVKKPRDPLDTGPRFDINLTPKPGQQIIALELTLRPQRSGEPVFSAQTVLIDSSGERHKALFAYPSALTTYKPRGTSIVFLDDWNQANKKVSELGGKVVAVFSVPSDRGEFKVEIDKATPVAVQLQSR